MNSFGMKDDVDAAFDMMCEEVSPALAGDIDRDRRARDADSERKVGAELDTQHDIKYYRGVFRDTMVSADEVEEYQQAVASNPEAYWDMDEEQYAQSIPGRAQAARETIGDVARLLQISRKEAVDILNSTDTIDEIRDTMGEKDMMDAGDRVTGDGDQIPGDAGDPSDIAGRNMNDETYNDMLDDDAGKPSHVDATGKDDRYYPKEADDLMTHDQARKSVEGGNRRKVIR